MTPAEVALFPDDFPGLTPRPAVKEGDIVAQGQPLITDKTAPQIALTSPMAGKVKAVVRGERRKLLRVVVETAENAPAPIKFNVTDASSAEGARRLLQESGLWAMFRQRPYDIIPPADSVPRSIMVTGFDSAPLAPDIAADAAAHVADVKRGFELLGKLCAGKVFVGLRKGYEQLATGGAEGVIFNGPHPAGNAGVQIAAIEPVNKGESVWTLDITTVRRIGHLIATGTMDYTTEVAITGSEVENPAMVSTLIGADLRSLLAGHLAEASHHRRVIAGNVLTGIRTDLDGFLHFPYRQVTVIPEGDDVAEFMGWASNSLNKMSQSRSFLSHFLPGRRFAPDARINGGRRAMIMSGQYETVLPMDVMPEYLIKAIIAHDIDRMEQLGIYEVAPEDFALCEYVDPSKLELQKIVRQGLDYLRKELS